MRFLRQHKSIVTRQHIKCATKISLTQKRTEHLCRVDNISREFKEAIDESRLNCGAKTVLVFDLEKVFETPKLSNSSTYYKRQLGTYNLCTHDSIRIYGHICMCAMRELHQKGHKK